MASYWTKRRRLRADVQGHLAQILQDQVHSDNQTCVVSNNDQGVDANVDQHSFNQVGDTVTEDSDIPIENSSSSDAESDFSGYEHDNVRVNADELAPQLAEWAIQHSIPHNALSALLSILRESHPDLPADARVHSAGDIVIPFSRFYQRIVRRLILSFWYCCWSEIVFGTDCRSGAT